MIGSILLKFSMRFAAQKHPAYFAGSPILMEKIHTLLMPELIDTLAEYTNKYTHMLSEGVDQHEYEKCKLAIEALLKEIEARKLSLQHNDSNSAILPDYIV
jgi:hypothetical protein